MKDFLAKYSWWIWLLTIVIIVIFTGYFYKKDFSKNFILISALLLIVSGIATVFSFVSLQSGLEIKNDKANQKTRDEITASVNEAVNSI